MSLLFFVLEMFFVLETIYSVKNFSLNKENISVYIWYCSTNVTYISWYMFTDKEKQKTCDTRGDTPYSLN